MCDGLTYLYSLRDEFLLILIVVLMNKILNYYHFIRFYFVVPEYNTKISHSMQTILASFILYTMSQN